MTIAEFRRTIVGNRLYNHIGSPFFAHIRFPAMKMQVERRCETENIKTRQHRTSAQEGIRVNAVHLSTVERRIYNVT